MGQHGYVINPHQTVQTQKNQQIIMLRIVETICDVFINDFTR